jgi:hypothetical protein
LGTGKGVELVKGLLFFKLLKVMFEGKILGD